MRADLIAAALRSLADAFEAQPPDAPAQPAPTSATEAPVKRGRGRPAKGEGAPIVAPAASPEADPFATVVATTPTAAVPVAIATLDEARTALQALSKATSQAAAVKVMKDSVGVSNLSEPLTPQQCAVLRDAAVRATPSAAAVVEADPFAGPVAPITRQQLDAPAKALTVEEVKAVITKAGSKVAQDTLMKIVMKHGGKAKNAETGVEGASLKALPESAYAAVVAEIQALPNTKG